MRLDCSSSWGRAFNAKNAHLICKYNYHAYYHLPLMLIDVGKQFFFFKHNSNGIEWYYRNVKRCFTVLTSFKNRTPSAFFFCNELRCFAFAFFSHSVLNAAHQNSNYSVWNGHSSSAYFCYFQWKMPSNTLHCAISNDKHAVCLRVVAALCNILCDGLKVCSAVVSHE